MALYDAGMSLKEFYSDPSIAKRALARDDTRAAQQAFVDSLRALGIESDRIHVEDFELFADAALASIVERFIHDAPGG